MELKNYQAAALDAFARWRDALNTARAESETATAALEGVGVAVPPEVRNYPMKAWGALAASGGVASTAGPYATRTDDAGRPIPHVCFKVPTGGGKTLRAAAALARLHRARGLTLWITPTRAIYEQTRATLRSREHPYRQMLERASGGRVRIFGKGQPVHPRGHGQLSVRDAADAACGEPAARAELPADVSRFGALPDLLPGQRRRAWRRGDVETAPGLGADGRGRAGEAQPVQRVQDAASGSGAGRGAQGLRSGAARGQRGVRALGEPPRPERGHRAVRHAQPGHQQPAGGHHGCGIEAGADDQAAGAGGDIDQR